MFRLFFCFSLSFLFFTSCKKDDASTQNIEEENFYALTVGNTWEYEVSKYNSISEEYELLDMLLNVEITESQVVNNNTYFRFQTTSTGTDTCQPCIDCLGNNELKRDSLGYLINDTGKYLFSSENLEDYLVNSAQWGSVYGVLKEEPEFISTPAGNFETFQNDRYALFPDGELADSRDVINYAPENGLVYTTLSGVTNPIPLYKISLKSFSIIED